MTTACVLLLCGCGRDEGGRISMEHYPDTLRNESGAEDADLEEFEKTEAAAQTDGEIYVVTSVNTEDRLIGLSMVDSPRTVQYGYTESTQFLDNFDQFMSTARLLPGRAVTIGELDSAAKLTTVQLAGGAWYQENITRFSIDASIGMMVIGDTKYSYDRYLRVFSDDEEISLTQVKEGDTISVQGIDKQIISVQVTKGHGTIALTNTELFEGGWISLGTKIYAKVTPNMTLEVPEGRYELSVANDGYGDSKQIEVERAQVTTIDLEEYKGEGPKFCSVTFEVFVEDALLYVDGEPVDYSAPVELRYGVHRLTVIADGFETWERQLAIHSEETTIQIGEPELADEDDDEKADDDDSDSKNTNGKNTDSNTNTSNSNKTNSTDDDSETFTSEEKGTSSGDVKGSTGDYGDYVDSILDLIESLVGLDD